MKIDITRIAGYETMTAEQKIAALEGFDLEPGADYVKKGLLDKAASEAADWKHKYQSTLTEQQLKEAKELEERQKLQAERDDFAKQVAIAKYKADYVAIGYSDELAASTAEAFHAGDMAKVMENQKAFMADYSKKAKIDAMKGMKEPAGGDDGKGKDSEAISLAKSIGQKASGNAKAVSTVMSNYLVNT